jgi:4-hydroxy 2-oxovalerate aldolase
MMAHKAPTAKLVEQAKLMESYGAECVVYVTDSAGAMLPAQYAERGTAFRQALKPETKIGVHTHHKALSHCRAKSTRGLRLTDL